MTRNGGWTSLLREETETPRLAAYSEFMPPPYLGIKPAGEPDPFAPADEFGWNVSEFEEAQELRPGLDHVARHVFAQLDKLARGQATQLSKTLLRDNPALPPTLRPPETLILPVALSRTQDDKGNVRWTLFGSSHEGPERAFWRSFFEAPGRERPDAEATFLRLFGDASVLPGPDEELPAFARKLVRRPAKRLLTFRFFAELPADVRAAYLDGSVELIPSPASLLFWGHQGYRRLAAELPYATQVPLLHLFPHTELRPGFRIPQSGWLDEVADAKQDEGHRKANRIVRSHRWQRVVRDDDPTRDVLLDDPVTVALFSNDPDHLGLYGKPMARNAQVWTEKYARLLDGPRASRAEFSAAFDAFKAGGRFGYRFFYPPMRVRARSVFWHRPILVRRDGTDFALAGHLTAEREGAPPVELWPRLASRAGYVEAAAQDRRAADNARRILEWRELLEEPLPPSLARRLLDVAKDAKLTDWLSRQSDELRSRIGEEPPLGEPRTFVRTATREFEERFWRLIAVLSTGQYREKNNADRVVPNEGRTGGAKGRAVAPARHLDPLGDFLHGYYEALLAGRGSVEDHSFRWETEFDYPWSDGWRRNQTGEARERNIIVKIPGRDRSEAVLMCDHYDTAYMEDLYYPSRGGDRLRAAASGADDNHSATAALMLAAEALAGMDLARDVWLVHLTGEEFPADCLGARALARDLLAGRFGVRVRGAYVLDMIAHNHDRDRDVFQIAPGEGRGSARLARIAHVATERWNVGTKAWNAGRKGRSKRVEGPEPPPIAEHPTLIGEIRPEWDRRSSLYNTDGQIFSDMGIPVVLFMENYDINRTGYHDTEDTMKNIDLDYGAAVAAIAIESVAEAATAP
ncbi:MAG: M28 family peptidase [Planctomycetes bacterium]|nr:M28 family peptidase [Planctomycetota bacterium]